MTETYCYNINMPQHISYVSLIGIVILNVIVSLLVTGAHFYYYISCHKAVKHSILKNIQSFSNAKIELSFLLAIHQSHVGSCLLQSEPQSVRHFLPSC